jgi:hypothetical protein
MLQDKKIEVKSERGMWQRTGNIAIEYESYGKPSGIASTESDYWFHNLCIDDETFCTLVFNTDSLKKIIDNLDYKRSVSGGDHNASKMYLVNLQKLFSSDVIKAFKDNKDVEN